MEINKIYNADCLEKLKELEDNSVDLIFTDPPYALGSDVIILPNGKPEYEKARDFMDKWNQPNGEFWEQWFKEAKRVLKFGGHCLVFGLDRQLFLYKYYACYAGFVEKQSLYWYFISNFPKASDLSKNIDRNAGAEREISHYKNPNLDGAIRKKTKAAGEFDNSKTNNLVNGMIAVTTPKSPLAKKYNGMKYSIAPLKQTNETIMVFQKKYKTGSCMHDVIAMENGDDSITCGALDIENNRVSIDKNDPNQRPNGSISLKDGGKSSMFKIGGRNPKLNGNTLDMENGRFPSQTICDSETAAILDGQSGISKSGDINKPIKRANNNKTQFKDLNKSLGNSNLHKSYNAGGCSKILHKCNYENNDYDIYNYCAKVSNAERNKGLSGMEKKKDGRYAQDEWSRNNMGNKPDNERQGNQNHHPTVKPISLLRRILSYFKTPNEQIVLDCFAGSGSMQIACIEENMNFIGYELNTEYFEIAEKRIFAAQQQLKLF